jgi:hypothetical protein
MGSLCKAKTTVIRSEKFPTMAAARWHECKECGVRTLRTTTYPNQRRIKPKAQVSEADIDTPTKNLHNKL